MSDRPAAANRDRSSLFPFAPDPDQTFLVLLVPVAPQTTYSTTVSPSHVETRVSLSQLREWLKEKNDGPTSPSGRDPELRSANVGAALDCLKVGDYEGVEQYLRDEATS